MEHVHLLTEARSAYEEVMSISTKLRNKLDAGDQILTIPDDQIRTCGQQPLVRTCGRQEKTGTGEKR